MAETVNDRPTHLEPSELGTKEYWDNYYQNDLDQGLDEEDHEPPEDPEDLEAWFDDVNAPAKVLEYLTSESFPYSPNNPNPVLEEPTVLDLGTGNGSMLFSLRMVGKYTGPMLGVDYSQQSIDLARKLWSHYSQQLDSEFEANVNFAKLDLILDDPHEQPWWPQNGFDLVLDKGTFDAISLSSEIVANSTGQQRRICELYPGKVADMIAPRGYLLVTSCNWTEEEVLNWFLQTEDVKGKLEVYGKIQYPVYNFGGQSGSGVASICFKKLG